MVASVRFSPIFWTPRSGEKTHGHRSFGLRSGQQCPMFASSISCLAKLCFFGKNTVLFSICIYIYIIRLYQQVSYTNTLDMWLDRWFVAKEEKVPRKTRSQEITRNLHFALRSTTLFPKATYFVETPVISHMVKVFLEPHHASPNGMYPYIRCRSTKRSAGPFPVWMWMLVWKLVFYQWRNIGSGRKSSDHHSECTIVRLNHIGVPFSLSGVYIPTSKWLPHSRIYTPWKIDMETDKGGLVQMNFPFSIGWFLGSSR